MNGSTKQVAHGAQESAASAGAATGTAHRPARYDDSYDPKTGQCAICRGVRQARAECQEWHRIWFYLDDRKLQCLKAGVRSGALLCKDCCIGRLDGHRCVWWDLCWNI